MNKIGTMACLVAVMLVIVVSAFGWATGSEEERSYKNHAYIEQDDPLFNTIEPNEVANKSILGENFQIIETHKGTGYGIR
jgi:flagellar basal body L-ring protein FlgH